MRSLKFLIVIFLAVNFANCQAQKQPNIILIVADDLGWGDVGFNGQDKIKTPNIDLLAKQGMVFNNFYAGSTVCGPSRASLMTGMHMGHSTVRGNPRWTATGKPVDITKEDVTIAEELKKAGYQTAMIGKWGLAENLEEGRPNEQGFDYFYGFNKHRPAHHYYPDSIYENNKKLVIDGNNWKKKEKHYIQDMFTDKAKNYLRKQNDKPFFLYLAYTTPHYELTVPEESKKAYRALDWPLREMKPRHYLHDKNGHVTYAAMVSRMDQQIGELMSQLKEQGLEENTIVIFTSDNGHEYDNVKNEFFNSNGPYKGRKRDLYEGGVKLPFVVKWPKKIKPNTYSNHISAYWDLLPTFCDVAAMNPTANIDGISMLNSFKGKDKKQLIHDYLYWEFNEGRGPIQAIRKGKWKLVKRYQKDFELYNLDEDEGETKNLASENSKILDDLKTKLVDARTENENFPLIKLNPNKK
ncbi:arylsulfatase [Urechidicola vernalis]|uniref:Arylsulfatase n=1 Tax=Urechidicola vernalis TaxID=3075600 RepID=A0ABU2Y3A6_9FLAO|nr:arylsulfatase [Urechidicola sp. P050]MDT0552696.1 arylsulfatase [Urechidicola sp. P050]